jgi:hypothetical protein
MELSMVCGIDGSALTAQMRVWDNNRNGATISDHDATARVEAAVRRHQVMACLPER